MRILERIGIAPGKREELVSLDRNLFRGFGTSSSQEKLARMISILKDISNRNSGVQSLMLKTQ
jgi:hypothetical protein